MSNISSRQRPAATDRPPSSESQQAQPSAPTASAAQQPADALAPPRFTAGFSGASDSDQSKKLRELLGGGNRIRGLLAKIASEDLCNDIIHLRRQGADAGATSSTHHKTAVHYAVQTGDPDVVGATIKQLPGVPPVALGKVTTDGDTALHLAARTGNAAILRQLLAHPGMGDARQRMRLLCDTRDKDRRCAMDEIRRHFQPDEIRSFLTLQTHDGSTVIQDLMRHAPALEAELLQGIHWGQGQGPELARLRLLEAASTPGPAGTQKLKELLSTADFALARQNFAAFKKPDRQGRTLLMALAARPASEREELLAASLPLLVAQDIDKLFLQWLLEGTESAGPVRLQPEWLRLDAVRYLPHHISVVMAYLPSLEAQTHALHAMTRHPLSSGKVMWSAINELSKSYPEPEETVIPQVLRYLVGLGMNDGVVHILQQAKPEIRVRLLMLDYQGHGTTLQRIRDDSPKALREIMKGTPCLTDSPQYPKLLEMAANAPCRDLLERTLEASGEDGAKIKQRLQALHDAAPAGSVYQINVSSAAAAFNIRLTAPMT